MVLVPNQLLLLLKVCGKVDIFHLVTAQADEVVMVTGVVDQFVAFGAIGEMDDVDDLGSLEECQLTVDAGFVSGDALLGQGSQNFLRRQRLGTAGEHRQHGSADGGQSLPSSAQLVEDDGGIHRMRFAPQITPNTASMISTMVPPEDRLK